MKAFKLEVPSELRRIPLVGNYFRPPPSQQLLGLADEYDLVFLKRDPNNPKDANAIKILKQDDKVLVLLGFAQRHAALRLTNFLKVVPNFLPGDYVVAGLHLLPCAKNANQEYEVVPFGVTGAADTAEMIRRYADSRDRYEVLIKSILEK